MPWNVVQPPVVKLQQRELLHGTICSLLVDKDLNVTWNIGSPLGSLRYSYHSTEGNPCNVWAWICWFLEANYAFNASMVETVWNITSWMHNVQPGIAQQPLHIKEKKCLTENLWRSSAREISPLYMYRQYNVYQAWSISPCTWIGKEQQKQHARGPIFIKPQYVLKAHDILSQA